MSRLIFILISSLSSVWQVVADLFQSLLSSLGLIHWADNTDPNTGKERGMIGNWVFYKSLGRYFVRGRPDSFTIRDVTRWKKRWAKFNAYRKCARLMKYELQELFEGNQIHRTWWAVLCSQMSKFWLKQPDESYLFSPGFESVNIGNGNMPDARNVVFTSPSLDTLQVDFDSSIQFGNTEFSDDTLQLMFIDESGQNSYWVDLTSVTRGAGTLTYTVPDVFGTKIYAAIKFKAGTQLAGKVKGIFRFPQGMQPVAILR